MATAPQPCLYPYPQAGIALTVLSALWAAAGPASSTAPSCAGAAHPDEEMYRDPESGKERSHGPLSSSLHTPPRSGRRRLGPARCARFLRRTTFLPAAPISGRCALSVPQGPAGRPAAQLPDQQPAGGLPGRGVPTPRWNTPHLSCSRGGSAAEVSLFLPSRTHRCFSSHSRIPKRRLALSPRKRRKLPPLARRRAGSPIPAASST
jgi:hypothetical protein